MEKVAIICDIDNCFTDSREWMKNLPETNDREEWDNVIRRCSIVTPNEFLIKPIVTLSDMASILFLTGREDRLNHREETLRQLKEFSKGKLIFEGEKRNSILMMRREHDYREAPEVKKEMLDNVIKLGFFPLLAIDDDKSNCDMFMNNGIFSICYNIEEGDPSEEISRALDKVLQMIKNPKS